jgi:4-hydroxybenzoate polyprenyltransferase
VNVAWLKFPVDDLDAYERRHLRNHRVAAAAILVLAPTWMFGDESVRVAVGITALVIGALVGLISGLMINRRWPELSDRIVVPLRKRVVAAGAFVALVLAVGFLLGSLGAFDRSQTFLDVFSSAGWVAFGVLWFLRAPAVARYRRRRYEADLAEVAGHPRPSTA